MKAWPFEPEPGRLPGSYNERFFGRAWPLGQDPIAWAMSQPCDSGCETLHGPSPIFGDTLGRQLDALHCDYVFTYPGTHPEAVRWVESHRFIDAPSTSQWPSGPGDSRRATFEVARLPSLSAGLLVVESIDTYLRLDVGDAPVGRVLVSGSRSDGLGVGNMTSLSEPDPFPLDLPVIGGPELQWQWELVHQWLPAEGQSRLAWAFNARRNQVVPSTFPLMSPWDDNRYGWGSRPARNKQIVTNGYGVVRLFCTLILTPDAAFPLLNNFRVGGGLTGYWQLAGRDAAAARNATHRT